MTIGHRQNCRSIWDIRFAVQSREGSERGTPASNGDHMHRPRHPRRLRLIGSLAVGNSAVITALGTAQPSSAATAGQPPLQGAAARQSALYQFLKTGTPGVASPKATSTINQQGDDGDLADSMAAYNAERTAPAGYLSGDAIGAAAQQAAQIPSTPGKWQQLTTQPYNGQPSNYTDPFWSNVGAGFSLVGGRVTALATTPDGTWFAGAADGGVWRSTDSGQHWTPVFDSMPTLSIGALSVDPADGTLWVGTGEANESQDSYQGDGVWTTHNDGRTWQPVGGPANPIGPRTIFRIA